MAAELAGVTIRSLRLYERRGLLAPARTTGGTRRYSQDDLGRLRRIAELVADGVNLTGIGKIFDLEQDTRELRGDNTWQSPETVETLIDVILLSETERRAPLGAGLLACPLFCLSGFAETSHVDSCQAAAMF